MERVPTGAQTPLKDAANPNCPPYPGKAEKGKSDFFLSSEAVSLASPKLLFTGGSTYWKRYQHGDQKHFPPPYLKLELSSHKNHRETSVVANTLL